MKISNLTFEKVEEFTIEQDALDKLFDKHPILFSVSGVVILFSCWAIVWLAFIIKQ
jgi:hypothetical protein